MDNQKQLTRPTEDRMFAGVCAGLARYFNVDPTLIRILFVVFFFMGGSSILIYIALWIVMPADDRLLDGSSSEQAMISDEPSRRALDDDVHEKVDQAIDRATEDDGTPGTSATS